MPGETFDRFVPGNVIVKTDRTGRNTRDDRSRRHARGRRAGDRPRRGAERKRRPTRERHRAAVEIRPFESPGPLVAADPPERGTGDGRADAERPEESHGWKV